MTANSSGGGYVRPNYYGLRTVGTGSVVRIYKNTAGETIGLDEIGILFQSAQKKILNPVPHDNELIVIGEVTNFKRTLIHAAATASRVIAEIKQVGDYASVTTDTGDYLAGTWEFGANDCELVLTNYVAQIGDTI